MSADIVIKVENLTKTFRLYNSNLDRLKESLSPIRRKYYHDFHALNDVSFEIKRGETVGIIGKNGSGKSTLLKLITGVLSPTCGSVTVNGKISALLELGSGFNPELTGIENVYFNGTLMGYRREEIDDLLDDILSFADIGEFAQQPIKTYSSGMFVRLAFAVNSMVNPDIFIVDEALAVGDSLFQKKCYRRIEKLIDSGTTLLFVSHDQDSMCRLTNRAILFDKGEVKTIGLSSEVILAYRKLLHDQEVSDQLTLIIGSNEHKQKECDDNYKQRRSEKLTFGDMEAEILSVKMVDKDGNEAKTFLAGEYLGIEVKCKTNLDLTNLNVVFRLRNKQGVKVSSWGTLNDDMKRWSENSSYIGFWDRSFNCGDEFIVTFGGANILGPNFYEVQVAVTHEEDKYYGAQRILHWQDEAAFFDVYNKPREYVIGGVCNLNLDYTVKKEQNGFNSIIQ